MVDAMVLSGCRIRSNLTIPWHLPSVSSICARFRLRFLDLDGRQSRTSSLKFSLELLLGLSGCLTD